jgi:phage shock protein A
MFKAIGRYFRALGYLLTGRVNKMSETLREEPAVISATYDKIISDKKSRINEYKDAIGKMVSQQESKKQKVKILSGEIAKLEKLKAGALRLAQAKAKELGKELCITDPEYLKCKQAYSDFSSTLAEKKARVEDLESDVETSVKNIDGHKIQIKSIIRDLEKIKEEKQDTLADVISAKEQESIADMMSGLSEDRSSEELAELRQMRNDAKAKAQVSSELAGLDVKRDEAEFINALQSSVADDEFSALMDFDEAEAKESGDAGEVEAQESTTIPEA